MSDQEKTNQEATAKLPAASHPGGAVNPHADQLHARLVEEFKQSLTVQSGGEPYQRWGYAWLHSLSDVDAMAQRQAMGFGLVDALDHYNQGCLLVQGEDYAGAATAFAKALRLDPDLHEAAFNLALALELGGKKAEAVEAWKACLAQQDGDDEEEAKLLKDHLAALADA